MTTSAERLQELESQLSGLLNLKPKNQKERKKLEHRKETLTRTVASLKVYLALSIHEKVTDGQRFGVIISKTLSLDGMPQAWVSWSGAVEVPIPPERLTVIKPPSYAIGENPQIPHDAPTIASLFTGGGLFEAGAMAAGFRLLWGIEFDPDNPDFSRSIADTYEQNFGGHIIRKSVQEVAQGGFQHLERPTVLHISQPCKSFSAANSKSESETDLSAARATCQAIRELQPPIVTIENVTSYRDSQSWQLIRETLTELGYSIKEAVVNAADYGVPQKRQRFLAYAVQGQKPPELPEKIASSLGWMEAIADLIPTLPESQLADWQTEAIQNLKVKIQNGEIYLIERTGARKDRDLLVRPSNEPSWTIKANIATDHKGANRYDPLNALLPDGKVVSLDARAIARLQSVPDWYELPEPIGVAVTLVGNGVPCLLAQKLMEALKPCLESQGLEKSQIPNHFVWLGLDEIRRDGGTQPRVKMDMAHIKRLEEQIEEGQQLEPVVVFHDGESYWMADGFHRWQAHSNQSQEAIACTIHQGSRRDAILYSVGANADHKPALPRSRQDKRRAVLTLLQDPEWGQWSNCKIAEVCQVNEKTVRNVRKTLTSDFRSDKENLTSDFGENSVRTYKTKHGTIAKMNTAKIGSQKASSPLDASGDRVEAVVESSQEKQSSFPEVSQSSPVPPQKVEVSTNDILIAFISNLDCMSNGEIEAVGKELAGHHREKAEVIVKAIANLNPDLIRQVMASK